ncbi:TetR family transcriptional regulator [Actinoplanes regularis]|uniref:TetR family transcriptional regulator n=1 Tax=Actinoplanes regularis TaxID=52697 RepID=UPI0024A2C16E|nr:TetR family transcriptional regulator [Actinoplanes regularis]GLW35133.1 TetR family transcriptional regulator [Actinoplanes regularis]
MSRWEPNARVRLEEAALKLYVERGFEQTTVAEIAKEAGLTERTFFRHFADKREVLFSGSAVLQEILVGHVAGSPGSVTPMAAVAGALGATCPLFEERREHARHRQSVIDTSPVLQERELLKLATLGAALAGALRERGTGEPAASLLAETGIAVFRVAFGCWINGSDRRTLADHLGESLTELKSAVR